MKTLSLALAALLLAPALALADTSTQDENHFDPAYNLVSFEVGLLNNSGYGGGAVSYTGVGVRYARTLSQSLLIRSGDWRDQLAIEGSLYSYGVVNYAAQGDSYHILPLSIEAQYGLGNSETWHPYLYAGVLKNFVVQQSNPAPGAFDQLNGFVPALGVGIQANFKGLVARADVGWDLLGLGLAYAF
jgi:hypothetical protein